MKVYYNDKDFNKGRDAVHLSDEKVQEHIDYVVESLKKSAESGENDVYVFSGSGDTMVFGFGFDENGDGTIDAFDIFVCKNYEVAQLWVNKDGNVEKMNWLMEKEREKYEQMTKEELINIILQND